MEYRVERDSMGEMKVPADVYWGAQTQRQWPTTTWENWISDAGT